MKQKPTLQTSALAPCAWSAAFLAMLLTAGLLAAGCNDKVDLRIANAPPTNAYGVSGGTIRRFVPPPGLPNDPTYQAMLEICSKINPNSGTAQGAYAVLQENRGPFPVRILIVGNQTLACLGDVVRNHDTPLQIGNNGTVILYPSSATSILLNPNNSYAVVGGTKVALKNKAVYWPSDKELIMSLPDLITVFQARDRKRGGHEIQFVKIIYDIRDYHR